MLAVSKRDSEGRCRNCGDRPVEAAHTIGRARDVRTGGKVVVSPDAIIPLCRSCHRAYDSRQLDILPLMTVREQARAVEDAGGIMAALRRVTGSREAA
jgi:5-methylcytosine-specific restriction endonuclease McrA